MADELDEFLKQAALRRMRRQQESKRSEASNSSSAPISRSAPAGNPSQQPKGPNSPATRPTQPKSEVRLAPPQAQPYSQTRGNVFDEDAALAERQIESSLANRHVSTPIDSAHVGIDGYVSSNMRDASTLGDIQNRDREKKRVASTKKKPTSTSTSSEQPAVHSRPNDNLGSSDLIHQLRNPQTLRMAILAHEILRRPYQ
jgi:N-acetylmuramoyl-L-alanine amidase CwlA